MKEKPYILLALPQEVLAEAGIEPNGVVEILAEEGVLTIRAAQVDEHYVCSGVCEDCPLLWRDCDGGCERCPCAPHCEGREVMK